MKDSVTTKPTELDWQNVLECVEEATGFKEKSDSMDSLNRIREYVRSVGWQPIATAPRDGTEIDLLVYGGRVTNAAWSTKTRNGIDRWVFPEIGSCTDKEATHWMPLPEPPND